jgi:hypothetical protein
MNRHVLTLTAALLAAALTASLALAARDDDHRGGSAHVVGLWGDVPYSEPQESAGVPNLIEHLNRSGLAFSVHVGDIKGGSSRCDDVVYARFEGYLEALRSPAIYTPGDNDWTDCDRPAAGGYDSEERLRFIRENLLDTQRSSAGARSGSPSRTSHMSRTGAGSSAASPTRPCTSSAPTTTAAATWRRTRSSGRRATRRQTSGYTRLSRSPGGATRPA